MFASLTLPSNIHYNTLYFSCYLFLFSLYIKMKGCILVLFISYVICQDKFYDRRYDYYDIDHFVENPRLLKKYLDCFLDKGPCTPIGRVFKDVLPEIVQTACAKCSPSQKRFARRTFEAFNKNLPESYTELKKKLDPQNKHFATFESILSSS